MRNYVIIEKNVIIYIMGKDYWDGSILFTFMYGALTPASNGLENHSKWNYGLFHRTI